jgi:TPR repeat protein
MMTPHEFAQSKIRLRYGKICSSLSQKANRSASAVAAAQYGLGFMLILGEGADKDIEKGLWWIEQAARNGEGCAARLLADIY